MSTQTDSTTPPAVATEGFADGVGDGAVVVPSQTSPVDAAPVMPPTEGKTFSEADIEAARRQEKDKLYGRMTELNSKLSAFEEAQAEQAAERERIALLAEEERKAAERDEMSATERLSAVEDELKAQMQTIQQESAARLQALQEEIQAKDALIEREREFNELQSYKGRLLQEYSDRILPELTDLVIGNTKEEVEASISSLVQRSDAIMSNTQQALQPQRVRGVPVTGASTTGPVETQTEQQIYTAKDISDMSMEDYAKIRDRLIAQARPR